MSDFNGRRIAITGGAGGIGLAIASHLAARGARVIALDARRPEGDLPAGVEFLQLDLLDAAQIEAAARSLYQADDAPISLVTSAGIVEDDVAAEDIPVDLYDRVMGVNLRSVFLSCQVFGRELLRHRTGAIVNIASMSGNHIVNTPQRQSVYNTSKAGVVALTKSLAVEWGPRGVKVNAISPGYVDTPLNHLKAHMHERWKADTVLGRFATPLEVAHAVTFLLGEESDYFTGAELLMDGGSSLI